MNSKPKTFAEKALERASGVKDLTPGTIIDVEPDVYMSHTASWRCIKTLEKLGNPPIVYPERVAMVMDHISPARTSQIAGYHRLCREFAREHGIDTFYDVNEGIAHLVLMENGHIRPNEIIIGTDSHSTIYGALGAFGTGVGYSEITAAWATGYIWMKVPESIRFNLDGSFGPGVYPKDLMLKLIGDMTADGATYCSLEFHGELARNMSVSERMTLCNLGMEMGAKNAYVAPDKTTFEYLKRVGASFKEEDALLPDEGAVYSRDINVNVDNLEPYISCPHEVDNVKPISDVTGTHLDQVFIGSCANAKYDDLVEAARVLKGKKIASGVRLIITPGSRDAIKRASEDGTLATLIDSGALITNPGCGACAGDGGSMDEGEVTLSTANRNFRGRMGSYKSSIYLSSPAVAAASAIAGSITDPREILR